MQVLNTIQTKLATTVAGLNQRLTIAEKKIGQLQTIGGPSFTFKNDVHILGNEIVDGTLTVGGAGQFNGGAGVTIAQNLIVGTTIVAGGTITANQVVAGGISTSASLGGTTIRTTGNAQFDGTLQTGSAGQFTVSAAGNVVANQVVAGGISTGASVGGTTFRGTGNAQFDGTLVIGGAAAFNGGAGVTIAQNLIVGTTITSGTGGGTFSVSATGAITPCLSIHCTGAGQFDTTLQSGTAGVFSVTAAGAITTLSAHLTGGFQVDGTANINTLNINGNLAIGSGGDYHGLSIHTTANAQFDGSLTSGSSGQFSVTSVGAITAASLHVGGGLTVDGTGNINTLNINGSLAIGSGGDYHGLSIHTTSNAQFDGSLTSGSSGQFSVTTTGAITAASIHTTGVVKADGGLQGPTIAGWPIGAGSGTVGPAQLTAGLASALNAIYNAIH